MWLKTCAGPIVSIPYTQECNDVAMMLIRHHKASEFYDRAMEQFEQTYVDAKGSARIMAISVHRYIMGAPHRTKYFRRIFDKIDKKRDMLFWTGEQILEWFLKSGPKARSRPHAHPMICLILRQHSPNECVSTDQSARFGA